MPTLKQCHRGEKYLTTCHLENLQVFNALKVEFSMNDRQLPTWVSFLEVIPAKDDPNGTFTTIPCVIINVRPDSPERCPAKIFQPSILPREPLATLTVHEAK